MVAPFGHLGGLCRSGRLSILRYSPKVVSTVARTCETLCNQMPPADPSPTSFHTTPLPLFPSHTPHLVPSHLPGLPRHPHIHKHEPVDMPTHPTVASHMPPWACPLHPRM